MSDMIRVSICEGKYTIVQDATGRTSVLRRGEAWREVTGDNVILGAAYEIEKLRGRVIELEGAMRPLIAMHNEHRERVDSGNGNGYSDAFYCFYKGQYEHWEKAVAALGEDKSGRWVE